MVGGQEADDPKFQNLRSNFCQGNKFVHSCFTLVSPWQDDDHFIFHHVIEV